MVGRPDKGIMTAVDRRQNISDAAQENQSDASSPVTVPDRNRKALLIDHTTPLGDFSPLVEDEQHIDLPDVASNTAAARVASEQRRHIQTTHLRRFHRQICMRVNERVELERRQMQLTEQSVSDKMARLLETRSSDSARNNAGPKLVFRRESHAKQLTEHKASILRLQNAESMITAMEKAIRADSQVRDLLLESTSVPRHAQVNAKSFQDDDEAVQANAPVTLPPKQRLELYSAVRRRFMEQERERVHKSVDQMRRVKPDSLQQTSSARTGKHLSHEVKIVNASSATQEFRMQRIGSNTSTPWRKPASASSPSREKDEPTPTKTEERFWDALQAELGTPALCSCRQSLTNPHSNRRGGTCANNCELYRHPRKKEKLLASVYKQHQPRRLGVKRVAK